MRSDCKGDLLIEDLLKDARTFSEQGRTHDLLQEYFSGYPVSTLRPLLRHDDEVVRREAVWLVSELGGQANEVVEDVAPLARRGDRFTRFHALEALLVCSGGAPASYLGELLIALDSEDPALRIGAMSLLSNASPLQLEGLRRSLPKEVRAMRDAHEKGLEALLSIDASGESTIFELLGHEEPLVRRYGAVAARRISREAPRLIFEAASHPDEDVREFADETIFVLDLQPQEERRG